MRRVKCSRVLTKTARSVPKWNRAISQEFKWHNSSSSVAEGKWQFRVISRKLRRRSEASEPVVSRGRLPISPWSEYSDISALERRLSEMNLAKTLSPFLPLSYSLSSVSFLGHFLRMSVIAEPVLPYPNLRNMTTTRQMQPSFSRF